MQKIIVLVVLALQYVSSDRAYEGECPAITPMPNFNMAKVSFSTILYRIDLIYFKCDKNSFKCDKNDQFDCQLIEVNCILSESLASLNWLAWNQ